MAIRLRHDAAAVALPSVSEGGRKYGQQLVLQEQQRKYQAQQAGYDRLFQLGRDVQQDAFQAGRDNRINDFQVARDKAQNDFTMKQAEAKRQQAFMDDARKQSSGVIMDDIKNGEYDPATSRKLQQNLVAESEALGNPGLDATQRAEALAKIRAERTMLTANRLQKPPPPTREEELQKFLGPNYEQYKDQPWVPDGKGGFAIAKDALLKQQKEQEQQQKAEQEAAKMRPKSFQDYYGENEDKFQKDLDATMQSMQDGAAEGATVTPEQALEQMQKDYDFRQKALGRPQYGTPTDAPALPGTAPAAQGPMQSIVEQPPAIAPDSRIADQARAFGMDPNAPAPVPATPVAPPPVAQLPDPGMPPAPEASLASTQPQPQGGSLPLTANSSSRNPAATTPSRKQVKVGGKPLAVTPGTLTPQETAARAQMMEMPREDRIKALMPYDPQFKGKTFDQILEAPETKAQYEELSKQGLTTGNYREDILAQMDETLQNNVLNGPGTPQDAYVGMRADEVTDPKAKAEVAKMPRPKTEQDLLTVARSSAYFVDPSGIIRSTKK